ncbi:MAG: rhodanese-like domain-containing protein [Prolixibacteraceae bacterium]|jgi:rhodanese-related sulfurtransferase|nr:rhodanese-like domain-containing protein [Prolixibacteraceae bacterium]
MNIIIAATKTCNHRPIIEEQLQDAGLPYEVMFFEDHPEIIEKYHLKTSPLFIVNDKVVSVGLPGEKKIMELKTERTNINKKDISEKRALKRENTQMVPQPVSGETGLVIVDTTWGKIQPMKIAEGVRTVGELEVHKFQENGIPVIDSRTSDFYEVSTISGAKNIPYNEIAERMGELDRNKTTVFFCNGPQCPQSPSAIRNLMSAGYPPEKILYYRGGMHDWITLGLPVVGGK